MPPATTRRSGYKFTDTSTRNPTSWHWEFGDGATSDVQNPVHVYTTPGTYLVNLTATNEYGSNTARMASTGKCIVALQPLPSSLSVKWARTYPAGTGSSILGYDVVQASDDGFALVGYTVGSRHQAAPDQGGFRRQQRMGPGLQYDCPGFGQRPGCRG